MKRKVKRVLALFVVFSSWATLAITKKPIKLEIIPKDGAVGVSPGARIFFEFNQKVENVTVKLLDPQNKEIKGDFLFASKSRRAIFDPLGNKPPVSPALRLKPETRYTLQAQADGESFTSAFTTGTLGKPAENLKLFKGRTYVLDLSSGVLLEPAGLGDILMKQLGGTTMPEIYVNVSDIQKGRKGFLFFVKKKPSRIVLSLSYAAEKGGISEPISFPPARLSNPYFSIEAPEFTFTVMGQTVPLHKFQFHGVLCPDAACVGDIDFSAELDLRQALAGVQGFSADQVKNMLKSFIGKEPNPCADGKNYCLTLRFADLSAKLK